MLTHNDLQIQHRQIQLATLPEAFRGFRIVQISDLHFYEHTDPAFYERVLGAILAEKPHAIALTGDVIHYGGGHLQKAAAFLSQLPNVMKFAVLGNHDYNDDAWGQGVRSILSETGFHLLNNSARTVRVDEHGEQGYYLEAETFEEGQMPTLEEAYRLWFTGLDDLWYGRPNIPKALSSLSAAGSSKDLTRRDAVVMLLHNPLLFDPVSMAFAGQVDLILAGHTHAGHVFIPFLKPIYQKIFRMKYRYGLFERNGCQMYVSSGVGSAAFYLKKCRLGFPRFRFNTWPEIASLELI